MHASDQIEMCLSSSVSFGQRDACDCHKLHLHTLTLTWSPTLHVHASDQIKCASHLSSVHAG